MILKNVTLLASALLLSSSVLAQPAHTTTSSNDMSPTTSPSSAQPTAHEGDSPAIIMPDEKNPAAPVKGKNSFTEDQAKERLSEAGYSNIGALMLDEDGVWRSTATKNGRQVNVALDYQGSIVEK